MVQVNLAGLFILKMSRDSWAYVSSTSIHFGSFLSFLQVHQEHIHFPKGDASDGMFDGLPIGRSGSPSSIRNI